MANGPPFATLNHVAADLGIPNESEPLRVGISHPSIAGINTDTGLSGSTQWHNAVRARFYMKGIKPEQGELPDNDLREIVFKKNQYGALPDSLLLRYQHGLFLPVEGISVDRAVKEATARELFLEFMKRFAAEGRPLNSNPVTPATVYAPKVFAREERAKAAGLRANDFAEAMHQLMAEGKIWNEPHGAPSRRRYRLAIK
jgi:hypothetical protein